MTTFIYDGLLINIMSTKVLTKEKSHRVGPLDVMKYKTQLVDEALELTKIKTLNPVLLTVINSKLLSINKKYKSLNIFIKIDQLLWTFKDFIQKRGNYSE